MQKNKIIVALSTLLMTLLIGCVVFSDMAKAEEVFILLSSYTCNINGSERTLDLYQIDNESIEFNEAYLTIEGKDPEFICSEVLDIGFDKYGTVWNINRHDSSIRWWNYDLSPTFDIIRFNTVPDSTSTDSSAYVKGVESLVFEGSGSQAVVVGYKTFSGKTYPLITFDEMKTYLGISDVPVQPTPTPTAPSVVEPTPTPAGPSVVNPTPTPVVPSVVNPTPTPTVSISTKISLKKSAGYSCLYKGNTVVSKFKIKKSVLTWQGNGKTKTFKGVKKAGFIKKSNNLIFMTKKGQVYTLSPNGKKKTILKRGAKKLILKDKFVVKVQTGKKNINVVNM